jgi:hypothetical protein
VYISGNQKRVQDMTDHDCPSSLKVTDLCSCRLQHQQLHYHSCTHSHILYTDNLEAFLGGLSFALQSPIRKKPPTFQSSTLIFWILLKNREKILKDYTSTQYFDLVQAKNITREEDSLSPLKVNKF